MTFGSVDFDAGSRIVPPEGGNVSPRRETVVRSGPPVHARLASVSDSLPSILFVCIGNMCRSPLAEAFARHHGAGKIVAQSAGLSATGQTHPVVHEILSERGISVKGLRSKGIQSVDLAGYGWVVSMAGIRAEAFLPEDFPGKTIFWPIEDPIGRPRAFFEDVADDIEAHVIGLLKEMGVVSPTAGVTGWAGMDGPGTHEPDFPADETSEETVSPATAEKDE